MVSQCTAFGPNLEDLNSFSNFHNSGLFGPNQKVFNIYDFFNISAPWLKPTTTTPVVKPPSLFNNYQYNNRPAVNNYQYSILHKRLHTLESRNRRFEKLTGKMDVHSIK